MSGEDRDGTDGVVTQTHFATGGAAAELVRADGPLLVPLDEAAEGAVTRAHPSPQAIGCGDSRGSGEEVDAADLPGVQIDDAARDVPYAHAVVDIAGGKPIERDDRPALEAYLHVAKMRVDVRDVAEPGQEQPAEAVPMIAAADGEPEDLYRILLLMCRRVGGPGVSGFGAVEVVAPECLLIAAPA